MEKEVWQSSFRDNLKKLSKSYYSVEKLEKKRKHCFHHIKNTLFYVLWIAGSKCHMWKEIWHPSFGDNLKKLSKSRVSVEKRQKKNKNIVSVTLKTLYFYVFWLAESKFVMKKEVWQPSFRDNLKKLSKSYVSVEKLEKKNKNIVSITLKTLYFYVFWLAESKFLMEKEVWRSSFWDNHKKLSWSRVSVGKLEKKNKNIVSITLKTLYFYVFWLAESKFVMEKEIWPPSFGDNLKNCRKAVFVWKNLRRKKKHCFHHIKNTLFYVFWLAESKFVMDKEVWHPSFRDNLKKTVEKRCFCGKTWEEKKTLFPSH